MIGSITAGLLAAVLVMLPQLIHAQLPTIPWAAPLFLVLVVGIALLIQRFVIDRYPGHRRYDGLADLFIHIHSPAAPDSAMRWSMRGVVSFLFSIFGERVGAEGAATEVVHALALLNRSRSSRWFEQRRRTDAATCLAAGVAAAFGAPFAAVLLPAELGIGGRTLYSALAAISAFLGARYLGKWFGIEGFDPSGVLFGFQLMGWQEWVVLLCIAIASGAVGALTIHFIRYNQERLGDIFQQTWVRILGGGVLLVLVSFISTPSEFQSGGLLEQILWSRIPVEEVTVFFLKRLLMLTVILSAFGTLGIFWPLFSLGAMLGFCINHWVLGGVAGFSAAAALAGGAAFWGVFLGTPLTGAMIAFELTQNLKILLPCLVAAFVARQVRRWLRTHSIVDKDLAARGVSLIEGRSASVLDAVYVREAMVTDHETVHEEEPVAKLYERLLVSRYPFLPVVDSKDQYIGLLTADMVQEGWRAHDPVTSHSPLSKLLEAKDLLYRSGFRSPIIKVDERLSVTQGMFEENPCVAVLDDGKRVVGLLFVYNVRLAYDREVARRSLSLQVEKPDSE